MAFTPQHGPGAGPPSHRGGPEPEPATLEQLVDRARRLCVPGQRRLLGVTGAPGAGKSTVAARLLQALGPDAALVPMDGFHLADEELVRLGRRERKGAVDTFDAGGFVHLLRRLRAADEDVVYAPLFDRAQEQSLAGALPVPRTVPLVIVEGNYLLLPDGGFAPTRALLHEAWFLHVDPALRRQRLVARHRDFGKDPDQALAWATGSDETNARLVEQTRQRADLVVQLAPAEAAADRADGGARAAAAG